MYGNGLTTDEAARQAGLRVFDTALPQDWAYEFADVTGLYPPGHIVWCYDVPTVWGGPVAIDDEGREALKVWNEHERYVRDGIVPGDQR